MTSNEYDITIRQGETYRDEVTLLDDTGTAINLTGATILAKFELDNTKTDITATITNATEGRFRLVISSIITSLYANQHARYDVFVTYSSGDTDCVLAGDIHFMRSASI